MLSPLPVAIAKISCYRLVCGGDSMAIASYLGAIAGDSLAIASCVGAIAAIAFGGGDSSYRLVCGCDSMLSPLGWR